MPQASPTPAHTAGLIRASSVPWQARPLTSLQTAGALVGVSVASLYKFAAEGRLVFKRLGGRTLVETSSLVDLIGRVEDWSPSAHTAAATKARVERARTARRR